MSKLRKCCAIICRQGLQWIPDHILLRLAGVRFAFRYSSSFFFKGLDVSFKIIFCSRYKLNVDSA